jgi:iron complex outermembrane receptor protein
MRGKLAYASDAWTAEGSVSYGKDDNDGYIPAAVRFVPFVVPTGRANRVTTDQAQPRFGTDPYIAEYPQSSVGETETLTASLNIAHEFDDFTLRSITGYVDLDDIFRWDIAAGLSPSPGVYSPSFDRASDATANQFTQELQALGTAMDAKFDWIVGAYYFHESGDQSLTDDIPLFFLRNLAPTFLGMDTDSWAAFGQGTYQVSDQLGITVGGRYTEDDKSFDASIQSGFGNPVPRTAVSLDRKFNSFTPKFGLDYAFTDATFGYLSVSRGFKAGGFNGLSVLNPVVLQAVYGPQYVWTYEGGLKAEFLDNRLRVNTAVFYNDVSGLQQTSSLGGGSFAQQNVGDATIFGVETEISAQPTDGLTLFATIGYMDGDYDSLVPTSQAATAGATDLPLVTDWTAQYGFRYEFPLGNQYSLRFGADGRYVGDHYLEVTNAILVKGYTRVDGFVAVGSEDGRWELELQGKNLTDEVNYVTGFVNNPNPALATLRPFEWMLSLKYRM